MFEKFIIFGSLIVLVTLGLGPSLGQEVDPVFLEDTILCRECGHYIASAAALVNLRSPAAVNRFNMTLFGVDEVHVQLVTNPLNIQFAIFTVLDSDCIALDEDWISNNSWFPGYVWKLCECPRCNTHIGWAFEPLESAEPDQVEVSYRGFYALEYPSVLSEAAANKLMAKSNHLTCPPLPRDFN